MRDFITKQETERYLDMDIINEDNRDLINKLDLIIKKGSVK